MPRSVLVVLCSVSVRLWASSRQRLLSSRSQTQMSLVVSNPTTHDCFSSWTSGTCRGLVPDLRETVEVSSMRRHVVPKMNDVDWLWKGQVCQRLEDHSLFWTKFFRSRPLDEAKEAGQVSRDRMNHGTTTMTHTDRTLLSFS